MRNLTAWVTVWFVYAWGAALAAASDLRISVIGPDQAPLADVRVQLEALGGAVAAAASDAEGRITFAGLAPGVYRLTASKEGFQTLARDPVELTSETTAALELKMAASIVRKDSIEVQATPDAVSQASPAGEVPASVAKELPGRPPTVADALPLVPGVLRAPGGGLVLSAAGEHRSAMVVNSADVTDPATGQFGLTVPIDSVESLNFYQTPFSSEYGRFTAGVVAVETRRGGDQWKWELNDPFPDFYIRSYRLRGLRDATPRLNAGGPLIAGKLYFSEGFDYVVRKTPVFTLPFPFNQKKQEGINSFAQIDWIVSARQTLTATVHIAPQRLGFVNLNAFNPEPTVPDASTHNYTVTIADRLTLGGGLLENTLSATRFSARVWGQGPADLVVAPAGNSGNYFAQQDRAATRLSWAPVYTFAPLERFGTQTFKVGAYYAQSNDHGQVAEHPIDIQDANGLPLERIAFTGGSPFRIADTEYAFFGQDHWILSPHLNVDLGVRTESQEVSEAFRVAPRAGIAWTPFSDAGTVVRAGFGFFYDRVPLNVYNFNSYPNQVITLFGPLGSVAAGPILYQNLLGQTTGHFDLVSQEPGAGNFSPRSATGSIAIEQPVSQLLKLRVGFMQNEGSGLVILNRFAPDPATGIGAYSLNGSGQSRYRQFEVTARVRAGKDRQLFFSYVRSRARGDLNDFASFIGSFPGPIVRPNQFGYLPTDMPNRFLAWGTVQLPHGWQVAPLIEYRSGFPYAVTDALQNYVGTPYLNRFPGFLSVDSRVSKDIKVSAKYSVRFSVSAYNLTNHYNPEAFHNNIADPAYGSFFGQRGRHFTADFDVLF